MSPGRSRVDSTLGRRFGQDSTREVNVPADGELGKVILKVGEKTESIPGSFKIFMGKPLDRKVSAKFKNEPLAEVLKDLCDKAGVKLELDGAGLKTHGYTKNMKVSIDVNKVTLKKALTNVLKPFDKLTFSIEKGKVLVGANK